MLHIFLRNSLFLFLLTFLEQLYLIQSFWMLHMQYIITNRMVWLAMDKNKAFYE